MSCPGEASANLVQNVNGNEASALAPVVPLETEAAEYNDGNHKKDDGTSLVETEEGGEPDAAHSFAIYGVTYNTNELCKQASQ